MSNDDYLGWDIGNFQLVQRLDSGSFGDVYLARNRYVAEHIVAIKLMKTIDVASQKEQDDFLHEAGFLVQLRHPHILPMTDCGILPPAPGSSSNIPYIVTEYAAQGSLRQRLKRHPGQALPPAEALEILSQVGQALQFAHQQNIVHRDIKPENILFNAPDHALLADFGIAIVAPQGTISLDMISGSLLYMAPEQFVGVISRKSDQYSLACIAYELLTGRQPFVAADFNQIMLKHQAQAPVPPRQINPAIPEYVEQAILRALTKDRTQRFDDVAAFIRALGAPTAPLASAALNGPAGRVELGMAEVTIGRAPDNRYVLADQQVSGHHAVIRPNPNGSGHTITDLGSMNGTFLNGQPRQLNANVAYPLKPGETIRVGQGQSLLVYEPLRPAQTGETVIAPRPAPFPRPPSPAAGSWIERAKRLWAGVRAHPGYQRAVKTGRGVWANPRQRLVVSAICAVLIVGLILLIAWPRPSAYAIATSGTPTLNNSLQSNSSAQWDTTDQCSFTSSGYRVTESQIGNFHSCFAENSTYTDFAYQVTMVIQQGDCGGLLFRANASGNSSVDYDFQVCQDGTYDLFVEHDNTTNSLLKNTPASSSEIKQGLGQKNVIAVLVKGNSISMYVNNLSSPILIQLDPHNTSSQGAIGVIAYAPNSSTIVFYTNAEVWTQGQQGN